MKKILILAIIFISLSGCSTAKYYTDSNFIDYSQYAQKGFFITESNSVNFNYTTIGSVSGYCYSGVEDTSKKDKNSLLGKEHKYKFATIEDAMEAMYQKATEKGANGIINMKLTQHIDRGGRTVIIVNGMAIKK